MISTLGFEAAEKLVNGYLRLDPDALHTLSELNGKTLAVTISNWNINCYIEIQSHGIALMNSSLHKENAKITGDLGPLLDLLKSKSKIYSPQLKIEGDMEFIEKLNHVFQSIDIDWEEHLSRLVGDKMTHQISTHGRKIKRWLDKLVGTFKDNTQEFIQEEAKLSPSKPEVEDFYRDINILRDDVERLDIKIEQLLNPKAKSPTKRDH